MDKIRIAAVGDIHVRHTDRNIWAPWFEKVSARADILVLCGDLTDTGDKAEAKVLAEEIKACTIPVIAVLGNHDHEKGKQDQIRQMMQDARVHMLEGESIVIKGVGFAGVKGFGGGFDNFKLSHFGEAAIKAFVQETIEEVHRLDQALAQLENEHPDFPRIAVLHYAPIKATVVGEPEVIFPFLGSSRLAGPLDKRGVTAAFHGHAHVGTLEGATTGGVRVFNVALPILKKEGHQDGVYLFEVA